MFTTSQFLQIHKFEVGDTLEKTLLRYFYIGSQLSDSINFLPGSSCVAISPFTSRAQSQIAEALFAYD